MYKGGDRPTMERRTTVRANRDIPDESLATLVAVLETVRRGTSHSRPEIAARTGLRRAVVAQRVGELLARGLLVESSVGPSTGGRPPRQLEFAAQAGHILVADIGATSIDVAVTDLAGRILGHYAEPADVAAGPEKILGRVDDLFTTVRETALPSGRTWGIGIGVPGPVDLGTARPVSPPIMPGWDNFPIRKRFTERHKSSVWVDNDVNLMALGEWRSGIAAGHSNVVFVKAGTGIGAGIISNGEIHRGAQGSAGDVGHIQIADDPSVVCRCGKLGCLEAFAGGAAIARAAEGLARSGQSRLLSDALAEFGVVNAEDVGRAAGSGDQACLEILQRSGRAIGQMLASVVNFFNPSIVVIGGGLANSGDHFLAAIRETVYARSLPLATRDLLIERSSLDGLAGVTGAAAMVLDRLFSGEHLAKTVAIGRHREVGLRLVTA